MSLESPWSKLFSVVGKEVLKLALREATSPGARKLKDALLGAGPTLSDIDARLGTMDAKLRDVITAVDSIEVRQIFYDYNRASNDLTHLAELFADQVAEPGGSEADIQRVCRYILSLENGVSERARRMIRAFRHEHVPSLKPFLRDYSDLLLRKPISVYAYLDRIVPVMDHLRVQLALSLVLRAECAHRLANPEEATDLPLMDSEIERIEDLFSSITDSAQSVADRLDAFEKEKTVFRIVHDVSGKYLTGYAEGAAQSQSVFLGNRHASVPPPQVYLYDKHDDSETFYTVLYAVGNEHRRTDFRLKPSMQQWTIFKVGTGTSASLMVINAASGGVLDGVIQGELGKGNVYLNPGDHTNENMMWHVVLAPKPDRERKQNGAFETDRFLLRHVKTGFALDGSGNRVYADHREPDFNNSHMYWRFEPVES